MSPGTSRCTFGRDVAGNVSPKTSMRRRVVTYVVTPAAGRDRLEDESPHLQEAFRWARQDSNLGPTDYESAALTAELRALRR